MRKRIFLGILLVVISVMLYHIKSVIYGIQQGCGQAEILWNAVPIDDVLNDEAIHDSVKFKLRFIWKVKEFAEQELGLSHTENYTTFYDQKGKPILWVITASPEFEIEAYEWNFPIAGSFPYKGFFEIEKAKRVQQKFEELEFDTEIGEVNAWSTLGWFKDPVLSSMLEDSEGRLAELIIHESTHATLYVKDSAEFNENLASFVGRLGAEKFLQQHFGDSSYKYLSYKKRNERKKMFKNYMRTSIDQLIENYDELDSSLQLEQKRQQKAEWIAEIKEGLFEIDYFEDSLKARLRMDSVEFNNAYFSGFSTYSEDIPKLRKQLQSEFKGDLRQMIISFKKKYKSL